MVSAIHSGSSGTAGATSSRADVEIQITRYKAQMADWVTCASAATPEGKNRIAQISTRLAAAETRLAAITAAAPSTVRSVATAPDAGTRTGRTVDVYA